MKGGLNTFLFQSGRCWAGCQQILKLLTVSVVPNCCQPGSAKSAQINGSIFFHSYLSPFLFVLKDAKHFFLLYHTKNSIANQLLLRFVSINPFFHGLFNTLVLRSEDLGFTQVCKTMVITVI